MLVRVCGPKNKDTEELIAKNFNNAPRSSVDLPMFVLGKFTNFNICEIWIICQRKY